MGNLKQWLLVEAGDEEIEAVVIGDMGWQDYLSEQVPNYAEQPKGEVLTWGEAVKWIDYEFDGGYGAPECNAVWAWTKSWVIHIVQYDGATWPAAIPRHPIDIMPTMEGGG